MILEEERKTPRSLICVTKLVMTMMMIMQRRHTLHFDEMVELIDKHLVMLPLVMATVWIDAHLFTGSILAIRHFG